MEMIQSDARMTRFRYRAVRPDGQQLGGTLMAASSEAAADRLHDDGLAVLTLRPAAALLPARRARNAELAVVFRNVATLVASGVPIERALWASEQLVSRRLADSLDEVRRLIREGNSVADAVEAVPSISRRSLVGIIRAGERGSALDKALQALALQLEESSQLQSHLRSALAYPALILVVGLVTVSIMCTVVIPRFAALLSDMGVELPPATETLLAMVSLMSHHGPEALGGAAAAGVGALWWLRQPGAQAKLHGFLLGLPLVGPLRLGFATARTCHALGAMLQGGMPLLPALDAVDDASGDMEVSRRLRVARGAVARGARLTEALTAERVLTPTALQLVGVGESSGSLASMVSRAGTVAGEQAERSLRTAIGLLEPALVLMLGALVAGVAAALLQAVYSIRPA